MAIKIVQKTKKIGSSWISIYLNHRDPLKPLVHLINTLFLDPPLKHTVLLRAQDPSGPHDPPDLPGLPDTSDTTGLPNPPDTTGLNNHQGHKTQ